MLVVVLKGIHDILSLVLLLYVKYSVICLTRITSTFKLVYQ